MRFALVAVLLCVSVVGLLYTYNHRSSAQTFVTAPIERGNIATLVKASGTVEAVVTVDVSSQLSGRIAKVFVGFNDSVRAGQPIAQLDQESFAAQVNEARAALSVARATAQVQKASLERARIAKKLAESQSAAISAKQDELERDLQRKLQLVRTGSGTERELTQTQAQHDAGIADLRASIEQIQMKEEAIAIAEVERDMAEANLNNGCRSAERGGVGSGAS